MRRRRNHAGIAVLMAISWWSGFEASCFEPPEITVPEGYVVEVAAAAPLVRHPMMATWDDRGRLYIAESAGLNLSREDLQQQLPNFIRRLEDVDGDGKFDKSTIFADRMTFPMGAAWHRGSLYVASSGAIWRLQDADDDGVAEIREKLVGDFGYIGNAADVHGCFLGPTGRIFWCEGRHGHDFVDDQGKTISTGRAARIFSCLPDGNDVRIHCGGGMDNPVEIDFTPAGEMLGTVNLFYRDRGDCLVHWMHGGVYPRYDQEAMVAEFKSTGDLLTEVFDHGHVAVSGMTRSRSGLHGDALADHYFVTEFNTHKVVRLAVTRRGATFRAQSHDFLTCPHEDFHPTDVLEDADGSLLVIDTGGWFRSGCPTSQIAKPNILGAIYRIRPTSPAQQEDPRGLAIDFANLSAEKLASLLADARFVVRERAIDALAQRGDASLSALTSALGEQDSLVRRNAIWTLSRIGSESARQLIRRRPGDPDFSVAQAAIHAVGMLRDDDQETVQTLSLILLADGLPSARREAATALGQIGDPAAVPVILKALHADVDRVLEHALIYALIELNDHDATKAGLASPSARVRRGALIALDQMDDGRLTRDLVAPLLDTVDVDLQQAALRVIGGRKGWSGEIRDLLSRLLTRPSISDQEKAMVRGSLLAFCEDEQIQQLVAETLLGERAAGDVRVLLLEVIGRGRVTPLPAGWIESIAESLQSANEGVLRQAIATASKAANAADHATTLRKLARDPQLLKELRVAALQGLVRVDPQIDAADFQLLVAQLQPNASPMERLAAARVMSESSLTPAQQRDTVELIRSAGPLELATLLGALSSSERPIEEEIARTLPGALEASPGLTSLTEADLRELFDKVPEKTAALAGPLRERLQSGARAQQEKLAEALATIGAGNGEQGRHLFFGKKAMCSVCHRVADQGGRIGPELTGLGLRRSRRDLLEAVLFPSASLARGFETYTIATVEGRVHTGLMVREGAATIRLRTLQQEEIDVSREEIDQMVPNRTSIMPAGLDQTMTPAELSDLIAYLESLK